MPGRIGSEYEIIRELRRGPWVTVYEAKHRVHGRRTLIKWLNPEYAADKELIGRLEREAKLGASVIHPNVAKIYGSGIAENRPYIAMEWIEGEDLASVLRREGKLSVERVIHLALDLLEGLTAIHAAGIIHRDLSPSNIRITAEGRACITDFGLAFGNLDPRYTLPGSVVGTPGYLSPEQASAKEIDRRADIFACGVLIYEALTGQRLFQGKDLIDTLKLVRTQEVPLLEEESLELPLGFALWLDRFLIKQPEGRWFSAPLAKETLVELLSQAGMIDQFSRNDRAEKSRLSLPSTLLPLVLLAILLTLFMQAALPIKKSPIDPPGLVIDNVHVFRTEDSALAVDIGKLTHQLPPKNLTFPDNEQKPPPTYRSLLAKGDEPGKPLRVRRIGRIDKTIPQEDESLSITPKARTIDEQNRNGKVLIIRTTPWANIYINNKYIGMTPGLEPIIINENSVTVKISNPDFPLLTVRRTLASSDTTTMEFSLSEFVGTLQLHVTPGAELFLDGESLGHTPLGRPLYLLPGTHNLRFLYPDMETVEEMVSVKRGEILKLYCNLGSKKPDIVIDRIE